MLNDEDEDEKQNNIDNDDIEFELVYSNDIKKIKELDNDKINECSTNISEVIKDPEQFNINNINEIILEEDKNKKGNIKNIYEKSYISLDTKNYLIKDDQKNSEELNRKLKIKYKNSNISEKLKELSDFIKSKLLSTLFSDSLQDYFSISSFISKAFDREGLLKKEIIEKNLDYFCHEESKLIREVILIDFNFINNCAPILAHIYNRLKKFKIKDEASFQNAIIKTINSKNNVKYEYDKHFSGRIQKSINHLERIKYFKKIKKKYIIQPELIYLMEYFNSTRKIIIDLNIPLKDYPRNKFYFLYYILCIFNLPVIIRNLERIKFNIYNEEILKDIYSICETKLIKVKEFFSYKKNVIKKTKKKSMINDDDSFFNEYKLLDDENQNKIFKNKTILCRNSVPTSIFSQFDEPEEKLYKSNKNINIIKPGKKNFSPKKEKKPNTFFVGRTFVTFPHKTHTDLSKLRNKMIRKTLEIIMITLLSFEKFEKLNGLDLILVDTYFFEFFNYFKKILKIKIENFHILNFIYNKLIGLSSLHLEINSFDLITFNEVLNILYNSNASNLKLSFFTIDSIYLSPFLYNIYLQNIKRKLTKEEKDNNANLNFNDQFYKYIYSHFVKNMNSLFEILKNKKLNIISIMFNIPIPILNDEKYIIIIIKFIMNLFILYLDNNESKTSELSILFPSLVFNGAKYLMIDDFLQNNNIKNNNLLMMNLRFKFYNIRFLYKFIPEKLRILNIGDLDIFSFKNFVNDITKYKFVKNSSLQQLSIRINNTIQFFNEEIKLIMAKLFNINIENLLIYLYTNINLNPEEYKQIIDILQYNWIINYSLSFNSKSKQIIKDNIFLSYNLLTINPKEPAYSKKGNVKDFLAGKKEKKLASFSYINFCLKNKFNNVNNSQQLDFYLQKKIFSKIFCYLYETRNAIVNFYEKEAEKNNII